MSPEVQRIAIAEACGWSPHVFGNFRTQMQPPDKPVRNGIEQVRSIPSYLSDLDAMHEAEKTLTEEQMDSYCVQLFHVLPKHERFAWRVITSTAAQRAEAFLRALGKWTD